MTSTYEEAKPQVVAAHGNECSLDTRVSWVSGLEPGMLSTRLPVRWVFDLGRC